ncbi:hypothetical protein AXF42_Ash014709 [Apostasia shenzhenica]|uniref:Uncharacterized protein n=1 Tax=Apostasia shenzhenica TaxID=1088818 RepID=A0A2H9ZW56_9ASPA|nr:hypothetical protein AXF42_Ash014709 [Apostasia shenzhenica]
MMRCGETESPMTTLSKFKAGLREEAYTLQGYTNARPAPMGVKPSTTLAHASCPPLSKEEKGKAVVGESSCGNIRHPLRCFRC